MNSYWQVLRDQMSEFHPQARRLQKLFNDYPYLATEQDVKEEDYLSSATYVKNKVLRMEADAIQENLDDTSRFLNTARRKGGQDMYDIFRKMYVERIKKEKVLAEYHYTDGEWNRALSAWINLTTRILKKRQVNLRNVKPE